MKRARIALERGKFTNDGYYNTTVQLVPGEKQNFYRPFQAISDPSFDHFDPVVKALLANLFSIDGVISIHISPYRVGIIKGAAFEWEDMDNEIFNAIKGVFSHYGVLPGEVELMNLGERLQSNKILPKGVDLLAEWQAADQSSEKKENSSE